MCIDKKFGLNMEKKKKKSNKVRTHVKVESQSCVTVYHLLPSLFIQQLDASGQRLDGLLKATRAYNVLKVLQHTLVVFCLTFRLHHSYLLHLALNTVHHTERQGTGQKHNSNPIKLVSDNLKILLMQVCRRICILSCAEKC